jgi:spermidine/putrescine transport system permease protein
MRWPRARGDRALWSSFAVPGVSWLTAGYALPLVLVVAASFATVDIVGRPVYGWHPENYDQVFQGLYVPVLLRSLLFAAIATLACLVIGYAVAYTIAIYGGRYRSLLIALVLLPWLVDYLIRIYAWQLLLGEEGLVGALLGGTRLLNTAPAVLLGLTYNYLPLMVLPIYATVSQLDRGLLEAGRDLYGSRPAVFAHVTLPNTMGGVVAGCAIVFLLTMGDWTTVALLGGPNQYMVGNLIQDQFAAGGSLPFGAGFTVVLLAVIALVLGVVGVAARRVSRTVFG